MNVIKTIEEIDKLVCKDVSGIIQSFLFDKCSFCDGLEYPENLKMGCENKNYCKLCLAYPCIKLCGRCSWIFNTKDGKYVCNSCIGQCVVYCNRCFEHTKDNPVFIDAQHYYCYWLEHEDIEFIDSALIKSLLNSLDTFSE